MKHLGWPFLKVKVWKIRFIYLLNTFKQVTVHELCNECYRNENKSFQITCYRKRLITCGSSVELIEKMTCHMSSEVSLQTTWYCKDLSHCVQGNGFALEWVLMWVFRLFEYEKYFQHCVQWNGFSPEWALICFFRVLESENDLSHFVFSEYLSQKMTYQIVYKVFSPEWVLLWVFRWATWEKNLSHCALCTREWIFFRISSDMFFQSTWVRKWLITLCTREWFFSRMSSEVFFSMYLSQKMNYHIVYKGMIFLQNEFCCGSSDELPGKTPCHIVYKSMDKHPMVFSEEQWILGL